MNNDENIEDLNIDLVVQVDAFTDKSAPPNPSSLGDVSNNNDHSLDSSIDDIQYAERFGSLSLEGNLENSCSPDYPQEIKNRNVQHIECHLSTNQENGHYY